MVTRHATHGDTIYDKNTFDLEALRCQPELKRRDELQRNSSLGIYPTPLMSLLQTPTSLAIRTAIDIRDILAAGFVVDETDAHIMQKLVVDFVDNIDMPRKTRQTQAKVEYIR